MQQTAGSTELLRPYLPRLLVDWLVDDPTASFRHLEGTLLFVDISGFTKLSERLAKKGKVGAEELSEVIGSCFAQLLAIAHGNGGGLIKFGGDALLIFFSGLDHEARACRSAVGMRETLREIGRLDTAGGRVDLRMSVGAHSGLFHFFLVGESHRELIVTGPAASQTVLMEQTAEAGEIVVSVETAAVLPDGAVGREKPPGRLLRRPPGGHSPVVADTQSEVRDAPLETCVPAAVRQHLLGGGGGPEHRQVTVAFLHFDRTDEMVASQGPEVVAKALDELVSQVQRVVDEHEVAFLATDIDRDGGKIILAAGAPRATGSDEERMLRTLRQIVEGERILSVRIGVNRGHVFAGDIGPSYQRTYTVMGDAVNLAARLMAKAEPGQILASLAVLERSRTAFETKELEPFFVKGKAEPIRAAVVGPVAGTRKAESSAELGPLFGRVNELRVLLAALESAKGGAGTFVEIVGEPGIGKSRLVEELKTRATDLRTLSLVCDQYESSTPYFPFRLLLRVALGIPADHPKADRKLAELVEGMTPHLMPWLPLIAIPLGVEAPSTPEVDQLDDQFRRLRLNEAVAELLAHVLASPTLLVFEDTHWMDEASGDLLTHLLRRLEERPWMVCATRHDQATGFVAPGDRGLPSIHLEPLLPEEVASLAWVEAQGVQLAPHEIDLLVQRSGGNPLFLLELVGGAQAAGGVDALPDSVDALIMARIDRLAPADRTLLRHAAVLGMQFREDLLESVLPEDLPVGDGSVWDRLSDFLEKDQSAVFRFRHGLIREVAYEGLPYRQRRELHARAGETIERSCGERPDDEAEILSFHFFEAGRFDKAWRFARVAGDRAKETYANVDAAAHYERALDAAGHLPVVSNTELAEVWTQLGDVRDLAGLYQRSLDAFRRATGLVEGEPIRQADLLLRRAHVRMLLGSYRTALSEATRGYHRVESLATPLAARARAGLSSFRAEVRMSQQRAREARALAEKAIEEARTAGEEEALARAYSVLDWAHRVLGEPERAVYTLEALAIYERLGRLHLAASMMNNLGANAYMEGRWGEAVDWYRKSQGAFRRAGDEVRAAWVAANIGEVLINQGRIDEAESLLVSAVRVMRAANLVNDVVFAEVQLGRLVAERGQHAEAVRRLHTIRAEAVSLGQSGIALEAAIHLAISLVHLGEPQRALALLEEAEASAGEDATMYAPTVARARALWLAEMGRLDEARARIAEALSQARRQNLPYERALLLLARVDVAHRAGHRADPADLDEAQRLLRGLGVELKERASTPRGSIPTSGRP